MATEKFTINSKDLVDKIKQLIHEGNVRNVRIIHGGKTVLEIPLTIGAPAAALTIMMAPVLAAVGAFAALVTECTIEVEKADDKKAAQ
jgi:phosphopantothenate synthetase